MRRSVEADAKDSDLDSSSDDVLTADARKRKKRERERAHRGSGPKGKSPEDDDGEEEDEVVAAARGPWRGGQTSKQQQPLRRTDFPKSKLADSRPKQPPLLGDHLSLPSFKK